MFNKASFSTINVFCSTGLNLVLGRKRNSNFFSACGNFTYWSSSVLMDDECVSRISTYIDDAPIYNLREGTDCCYSEIDNHMFPKSGFGFSDRDDEMRMIKRILIKRGWNLNTQNGYRIDLDQHNIIQILNDLFEESLDASLALYFFRWSESCTGLKHSIRSVCMMIGILVSGNMNYRAIDLIRYLVRTNGEERWHDLVLEVIHETCRNRKVLEIVYSMLINCYVQENMIHMALRSHNQMKCLSIFPSIRVCNTLLRALLSSEKLELACDLLEEMQRNGIALNASITSLFIYKYCTNGDIQSGWKLLMDMKNQGVKPDVVTYTIIIDSLCKMFRLTEATSLLFKMTRMGISLDSVSVSSVIDGFCKNGKPEEAHKLWNLFNFTPNIFVYNSFISKLCTDGEMEKASEIFFEMLELGLVPDCFSFTTIIGGYCKLKDRNKALEFLGKMLKRGIKPSLTTYTLFIGNCCKSGDMEMAETLFQNMIREGKTPDIVSYNILIDGYGNKGHTNKAYEVLSRMRSANIEPDVVSYNTIIHSLISRGFVDGAKNLLHEVIRRGISLDVKTFTEMTRGLSKKENFEEVFTLWNYMSEYQVKPDVVTCSALINGYCKAHRMEEAKALFKIFINDGLIPDLVLYNTLVLGFCSIGDTDDALNLVYMMVEKGLIPNCCTLRALVRGFEKKRVHDPINCTIFKMQEILLKFNIHVDMDHYLDTMQTALVS